MDIEVPMTPEILKDEIRFIRTILYQHVQHLTYLFTDLAIDYEIDEDRINEIMKILTYLSGNTQGNLPYPSEREMQ